MLLKVRQLLHKEKRLSNQQIARELNIDFQALQPMLEFWMRKGTIAAENEAKGCATKCHRCDEDPVCYYFYLN